MYDDGVVTVDKQLFPSISRGEHTLTVYTDNNNTYETKVSMTDGLFGFKEKEFMWVSDTNELKVEGDFGDATIEKIKYQGTHEYDASLLRAILVDNEYFDIMKNEITIDNELLNKFNLRANLTFAFSNDISDVLVINCLKSIHTADYDVVSTEYAFGNLLMDIVVKIHRRKRNRRQIFKVCSKRFKRISKQK